MTAPDCGARRPSYSKRLGVSAAVQVIHQINACRKAVLDLKLNGTLGLVPTMGALHAGHLSLVHNARRQCDHVAVTIFVNPTQFAPHEDFASYPQTLEADVELCRAAGVALVFAPTAADMYPGSEQTTVQVHGLTDGLCGPWRPGHFDGVATVVAKLFHILPADAAFFGEKDYQQLQVIRQMVRDLNFPVRVVACPTVREPDGLAMSSRNAYLTLPQRRQAVSLSRTLFTALECVRRGERTVSDLVERMRADIQAAGPCTIEYIEAVDAESLRPLAVIDCRARLCLAVRIGPCRLIDNVAVDGTTASN